MEPAIAPAPTTHQVTADLQIVADDERIRATIQYAKGYAKACKSLGIEIPTEIRGRIDEFTARRRNRVQRRVRRGVVAATAVGTGFVGINAAAAYYTAAGTGAGGGTTTTMQSVAASGATVTGTLLPDNSLHNVTLTVTNPNDYPVTLTGVSGDGAITSNAGAACNSATGVTFTDQTGLSQSIPGNSVATPITLNNAAKMDTSSDSSCQGATFTIPVTITVKKA